MINKESNKPISVSIVDDDPSYRESIKLILESDSRIRLHGEYSTGTSFINSLNNSPFKPDVCLVDIILPDILGTECSKIVKQKNPDISVIIMTSQPTCESLMIAQEIGADYIEKGTLGERLIDKIILNQECGKKEQLISLHSSSKSIHNKLAIISKELEEIQNRVPTLTDSQKQVLILKQSGKSKQEIANSLNLSSKTIQFHINNAEERIKLKVNDNLFKHLNLY